VVYLVLGVGKAVVPQEQGRFRRRAFLLFVVGLLLVTVPLSLAAYQNVMSARENANAAAVVQQWVAGTPYHVDAVTVNKGAVDVTIDGTGPMKPVQQLADQLAGTLGHPVVVDVRTLPTQRARSNNP
jgi:hypothetical protein